MRGGVKQGNPHLQLKRVNYQKYTLKGSEAILEFLSRNQNIGKNMVFGMHGKVFLGIFAANGGNSKIASELLTCIHA